MAQTQALESSEGEAAGEGQKPASPVAWDCTTCGACCIVAGDVPVEYGENGNAELTPKKYTYSGKNSASLASWEWEFGIRIMKRREPDNRCIALEGTAGSCVSCKVYDKRPKVCREFEAGSQPCIRARTAWALKHGKVSVG